MNHPLDDSIDTRQSTGVRWQPSTTAAEPLDNGRILSIAPPNYPYDLCKISPEMSHGDC